MHGGLNQTSNVAIRMWQRAWCNQLAVTTKLRVATKVAALAACFRVHCKEARLCQDRKCFQLPGCHLPDEIVDLAESRPQFLRRSNKASVQKRSCARVLT